MAFVYPIARELLEIDPEKVATAMAGNPIFDIMPVRTVDMPLVQWTQEDNWFGLQQLRGLDGQPTMVKPVGAKTYSYEPGIFGEFRQVTETELTLRAGSVRQDVPIDVSDLVTKCQDQLISREVERMGQIGWTLVSTGTFSVSLPGSGGVGFTDTFTLPTYTASDWSALTTGTPLLDFRAMAVANVGKGADFGAGATAYMNRITANYLLGNTNAADLGGRRVNNSTIANLMEVNRVTVEQDTPQIKIVDDGYYDDSNAWTRHIATDKVVVVGRRKPGQPIAEYLLTRNMNNPNGEYGDPGRYMYIKDRTRAINGEKQTPPNIEVHRGHNGGPVIYYPASIVIMNV